MTAVAFDPLSFEQSFTDVSPATNERQEFAFTADAVKVAQKVNAPMIATTTLVAARVATHQVFGIIRNVIAYDGAFAMNQTDLICDAFAQSARQIPGVIAVDILGGYRRRATDDKTIQVVVSNVFDLSARQVKQLRKEFFQAFPDVYLDIHITDVLAGEFVTE